MKSESGVEGDITVVVGRTTSVNAVEAVSPVSMGALFQTTPSCDRTAWAQAIGHVGEPLQGAVDDEDGIHRFLVTLPAPVFWARASFQASGSGGIQIEPEYKRKSRDAAVLTAQYLRVPDLSGTLRIHSNIPEGRGLGSSTADCSAAVRAIARWLRKSLRSEEVASLVWRAEGASDSTMFFDRPVSFCHREGRVQEYLPGRFPNMFAIVIDTDPLGKGVDTDKLEPASYATLQLREFRVLLGMMRRAFRETDPVVFGRVSSISAEINQEFLPKLHFAEIRQLSMDSRAYGLVAAHSGTVMSLLYDPSFCGTTEHRNVQNRLRQLGTQILGEFSTSDDCFAEVAA